MGKKITELTFSINQTLFSHFDFKLNLESSYVVVKRS